MNGLSEGDFYKTKYTLLSEILSTKEGMEAAFGIYLSSVFTFINKLRK